MCTVLPKPATIERFDDDDRSSSVSKAAPTAGGIYPTYPSPLNDSMSSGPFLVPYVYIRYWPAVGK